MALNKSTADANRCKMANTKIASVRRVVFVANIHKNKSQASDVMRPVVVPVVN